jgi:hypothetical protein
MCQIVYPERCIWNYHSTPSNSPEERSSKLTNLLSCWTICIQYVSGMLRDNTEKGASRRWDRRSHCNNDKVQSWTSQRTPYLTVSKFYLFTNWYTSELSQKYILKLTLKELLHVSVLQYKIYIPISTWYIQPYHHRINHTPTYFNGLF